MIKMNMLFETKKSMNHLKIIKKQLKHKIIKYIKSICLTWNVQINQYAKPVRICFESCDTFVYLNSEYKH